MIIKTNHSSSITTGIAVLFMALAPAAVALAETTSPDKLGPNTTISFKDNTAKLTSASKAKLDLLIKDAKIDGKINQVQVAAWSDNPAPRTDEELSRRDRRLADSRAKAIDNYLSKRSGVDVKTFNMAERANWLARAFNTEEAELKKEIGQGGDAPLSNDELQIFKSNGRPSKAVVLVILKQ